MEITDEFQNERWREYDRLRTKRQNLIDLYDSGLVGLKKVKNYMFDIIKKRINNIQEEINNIENILKITFTAPIELSYEAAQQRIKSRRDEIIDL